MSLIWKGLLKDAEGFTDLKYEDEYDDKLAQNFWKVRIF